MQELSLIQKHTREIYDLDSKSYSIENVNARTLLTGKRFDLFAKLYYLTHYKENKEHALCVYIEHIKAFNPDGKEPGRDDKLSFDDFVSVFNNLIESFKDKDFDKSVSLVPVDSNGVILDGAHRVAILAYYNKEITIARFKDVTSKANFDYQYFKMRGLSWVTLDEIALEMMYWLSDVHVMCIWPTLNENQKTLARNLIENNQQVVYRKKIRVTYNALTAFVKQIYQEQEWTHSIEAVKDKALRCYGKGHTLELIFFTFEEDLNKLISFKDDLRSNFGRGKDSLHITDNVKETQEIAELVLNDIALSQWNKAESNSLKKIENSIKERIYYFKNITLLDLKTKIAKLLR